MKRLIDIFVSAALLIVLAPLIASVAAAVRLTSKVPILYRQPRLGLLGKSFAIMKFRSMQVNAPDLRNTDGSAYSSVYDPRLTRIGRFLRQTSLDELPQLVNVLKGEMQLVGVRPEVERYVEIFTAEYEILLQDRPGITDIASLAFRNEEEMFQPGPLEKQYVSRILPRKLKLSLKYFQARTFLTDLGILVRTVLGFKSPMVN